jgi:LysM repeat protein
LEITMKIKRSRKSLLITLGILLFIAAAIFGAFRLIDWIGERKRTAAAPPTVYLNNPKAGEVYPVGQLVYVQASAVGTADIQVLELRLDGQSTGKAFNDDGIDGAFDGQFEITITDGPHSVSVRATDQNGLIGQSIPIQIFGTGDKPEDGLLIYISQEGDTLESIAEDFDEDLDDLKGLNPDLGDGVLPPGTRVKIPQGDEEEPAPDPAPAGPAIPPAPPAPPGGPPPNTTPLVEITEALPIIDVVSVIRQLNTPKAPDGLTALHEDCLVTLSWNDNSTNEDSFRIWFAGLGLPPRVIANVSSPEQTGPVWYQFNTPPAGIYSFWVEAVNALGAQPSEDIWIGVPATQCEDFTAPYLYFSVNRLEVFGNYDTVYCYISAEGAPEYRFPQEKSLFYQTGVLPTDPQSSVYWGGIRSFVVPYPADGTIDIEGECLAWSGGSLNSLGNFDSSMTANELGFFDTQFIETPNFTVWMIVRPYGKETPEGTYTFFDPTIQPPFNLDIFDTGFSTNPNYPSDKYLSWEWRGNEEDIEGFTVYMNGNPFKLALPHERAVTFPSPGRCGMHLKFEVAANLPNGQTDRSQVLPYDLIPCSMQAVVVFHSIQTGRTNDSPGGDCDQIETYFELVVWGAEKYQRNLGIGSGYSFRYPMTCNKLYEFDDIGYALTKKRYLNWLPIEIDPMNPKLEIGLFGWDYDWGSDNDPIIMVREKITDLPVKNWKGYQKEIILRGSSATARVFIFTEY